MGEGDLSDSEGRLLNLPTGRQVLLRPGDSVDSQNIPTVKNIYSLSTFIQSRHSKPTKEADTGVSPPDVVSLILSQHTLAIDK